MISHLITGSRKADHRMTAKAKLIAIGFIRRNDHIIVGDADGVDASVIDVCNRLKYANIEVWGHNGIVRHRTKYGMNYPVVCGPIERDRKMAEGCDDCTAVWDGYSGGTWKTMEFARSFHKPVTYYAYGDEPH